MKKENLILTLAAIAACLLFWLLLTGCGVKLVVTKEVYRKEIPPYIEIVMGEVADSCRVTAIENLGGEMRYVMLCKSGAKEWKRYVIKKSFDGE